LKEATSMLRKEVEESNSQLKDINTNFKELKEQSDRKKIEVHDLEIQL